jgi:hypothetical protein
VGSFFAFTLKIMSIERFDPDLTDGYDDYERPSGYRTIDGKKLEADPSRMKLVSVMISPGIIAKCPIDTTAMNFKEDQEIKIIMAGKQVAAIANIEDKTYVYFNDAVRKRYNTPRVVAGINMSIITAFAGYILVLIFKHQQAKIGLAIVEGASFFLFVSSVIYAIYYYLNDTEAYQKLRHYMQKILK